MSFLQMILAFLFAILLLVSLHELGHLVVARWCGIKVLRFSVGFGKPFYTKRWRNIEWCLAPFPLGGYVKMVDTREGNVDDADLPYAFDKQHPLKRIAVVAAGPLVNLALAVVLYALAFGVGGVHEIRPFVGEVRRPSIAASAGFQVGDQIVRVNQKAVHTMTDVQTEIVLNLEAGAVHVEVLDAQNQPATRIINAKGTPEAEQVAKRQIGLGISPFKTLNQIAVVAPNGAAAKAGLQAGDQIIAVNGVATPNWNDWAKIVRENAGRHLKIDYQRAGMVYHTNMMPESVELPDRSQIIGRAGLAPKEDEAWTQKVEHHRQVSFAQAIALGWDKTVEYSSMTLKFFGKLIIGKASLNNLSGPLTIADVAGRTIQLGWQPYVEFLALVSISLGVMNLLPIPVLDGGHLVYYTTELIRGKPLSKNFQEWGLRFGVSLMLAMMLLAFLNDITRLFG